MSLQDRLAEPPSKKSRFLEILNDLDEGDREALIRAAKMGRRYWSDAELMRLLLEENNVTVGKDTFSAWRRAMIAEAQAGV